jgi:hypothetical protein
MASPKTNLPTGTVKRRDKSDADKNTNAPLVLNTKAKARRIEKSEASRDEFYEQIRVLYADGDKGANELLSKVSAQHKNPFRAARAEPSGAPKTNTDKVDHPRLAGLVETVHRVTDTLVAMFKRKQIGEREYLAADKYRSSFAALYGVMGGVGDYERSRGGSTPGQPPAPHYMLAAETVSEVKRYLYPKDYAVVHRVVALGMSLEEASSQLYQQNPTRAEKEDCGRRLREGLTQMADKWFPENRGQGNRMRSHLEERAGVTDAEFVPQASVVHATRDKLYRSGE